MALLLLFRMQIRSFTSQRYPYYIPELLRAYIVKRHRHLPSRPVLHHSHKRSADKSAHDHSTNDLVNFLRTFTLQPNPNSTQHGRHPNADPLNSLTPRLRRLLLPRHPLLLLLALRQQHTKRLVLRPRVRLPQSQQSIPTRPRGYTSDHVPAVGQEGYRVGPRE